LFGSSCSAMDLVFGSWRDKAEQTGQMARTQLSRAGREIGNQGINVRINLQNAGQTSLADFSRWDVIVQYYGKKKQGKKPYFIKWLAFTNGVPGDDQWRVEGIFEDAQTNKPEVFEPGVLNRGEEIKIHMKLKPMVGVQTTNWVTVVTFNGLAVPVIFTR